VSRGSRPACANVPCAHEARRRTACCASTARGAAAALERPVGEALATELAHARADDTLAFEAARALAYVGVAEARLAARGDRAAARPADADAGNVPGQETRHAESGGAPGNAAVLRALDAADGPSSPPNVRVAARLAARRIRALAPPR
jgi:hypothetical protein